MAKMVPIIAILLQINLIFLCDSKKIVSPILESKQSSKHNNPNFVRDRLKDEIDKPHMHQSVWDRHRKPFNSAWMDYCDPYHCNDYHKIVCGLNRKNMRFQWFQSLCHLILNNQCYKYRGFLKYDVVDNKFCTLYVFLRNGGCPSNCDDDGDDDAVCALGSTKNDAILFRSMCALDMLNCKNFVSVYNPVDMSVCQRSLLN